MDKSRDVRRGVCRFSRQIKQQSKHKLLLSGLDGVAEPEDCVAVERPKKERLVKKLSVLNKPRSSYEDSEMGCNNMSDGDNELPSQSQSLNSNGIKRFKPSRKFLDDCNGVDHASVPRKLRSAMKKRNGESIAPAVQDSKKLNHKMSGVESTKKDGLKKSKLNMKQGSSDWPLKQPVGPITKDEEEVVETLYALAGMFPDNDTVNSSKLGSAPSEAKPPNLPEYGESSTPTIEGRKEDLSSTCPLGTSEAASSANIESSLKETAKIASFNEPTIDEKPDMFDSKNSSMKSDSCVPQVDLHNVMPSLAKEEYIDNKPSCSPCSPVKFQVLPDISLDSGLKQPTHVEGSFLDRKLELTLGATRLGSQVVQQDIVKDSRKNGQAWWPALSPMVLHGAGCPSPLQSSTAKNGSWLDAAICASSLCSFETGSSIGQVPKGATDRTRRRSTAHVYISRLIRDLQMPDRKEKSPIQPNQLKPSYEGQKQGSAMAINDFQRINNGLNNVIANNNIVGITAEINSRKANANGILQHKRLYQDQQQTATSPRAQTLQKQSFDFLSLSAEGRGAEATNRTRNRGLEPSSHFQLSCLHSVTQHQKFMPISMPRTHHTGAYPDQLSASAQQIQLQLSSYHSSPYHGSHPSSSTVLTKQQHQQQQQQQLWAAQLAAQCRPAGTSTNMNQLPSWINGRQDPVVIPCTQPIIPPSTSSTEFLGPKYTSNAQHQPRTQSVAFTSIASARTKRQDHHLPSVYEEIEGGFRGVVLPLQLLCNERI